MAMYVGLRAYFHGDFFLSPTFPRHSHWLLLLFYVLHAAPMYSFHLTATFIWLLRIFPSAQLIAFTTVWWLLEEDSSHLIIDFRFPLSIYFSISKQNHCLAVSFAVLFPLLIEFSTILYFSLIRGAVEFFSILPSPSCSGLLLLSIPFLP